MAWLVSWGVRWGCSITLIESLLVNPFIVWLIDEFIDRLIHQSIGVVQLVDSGLKAPKTVVPLLMKWIACGRTRNVCKSRRVFHVSADLTAVEEMLATDPKRTSSFDGWAQRPFIFISSLFLSSSSSPLRLLQLRSQHPLHHRRLVLFFLWGRYLILSPLSSFFFFF